MRISDWSSDVCSSDLFEDLWRRAGAGGRGDRDHQARTPVEALARPHFRIYVIAPRRFEQRARFRRGRAQQFALVVDAALRALSRIEPCAGHFATCAGCGWATFIQTFLT